VIALATRLSSNYRGGLWAFYSLCNGGFYMAPATSATFMVCCPNGFEGELSADALGITACLYAYSALSFEDRQPLAERCAGQYHLLRAPELIGLNCYVEDSVVAASPTAALTHPGPLR
jgi:Antirestriction protein